MRGLAGRRALASISNYHMADSTPLTHPFRRASASRRAGVRQNFFRIAATFGPERSLMACESESKRSKLRSP